MFSEIKSITEHDIKYSEYNYTYDKKGNLISKNLFCYTDEHSTPGATTYTYDALNRLTSVTETDGTITSYTFDSGNNIMTKNITHTENCDYTFTQNGIPHTISGLTTHNYTYAYNELNQLMQETEYVAGTEDVAAAYAATYPIALIAVVLISQLLIIFF